MFRRPAHCDRCDVTFPSPVGLARREKSAAAAICPSCARPARLLAGNVMAGRPLGAVPASPRS